MAHSLGDGLQAAKAEFQSDLDKRDRLLDLAGNLTMPDNEMPAIARREGLLLLALAKTIRQFPEAMWEAEAELACRQLRLCMDIDE